MEFHEGSRKDVRTKSLLKQILEWLAAVPTSTMHTDN